MLFIKNTLPAALLLCSLTCFAQADKKNADPYKYDINTISIQPAIEKIRLPVGVIQVYDIRFDTSCLGISSMRNGTRLKVLKLKRPLVEEITDYYRSLMDTAVHDSEKMELHCFVKKLILSDYIDKRNTEEKRMSSKKYDVEIMSGIFFIAEFYVKRENNYIPLYRFDTAMTGLKEIDYEGGAYIANALMAGLKKVARTDTGKIYKNNGLSREKVDSFNRQRFDIPILQQQPSKGIYYTFKDFLNNTPATEDFVVERDKKGDFLYLKNGNGQDKLLTELWGYSDGKESYIYSSNNYFRLQRTGNGFKTYGAKDYTGRRNLRANFGAMDVIAPNSNFSKGQTRNKYYLIKDYFLLDMETGELY